MAVGGEFGHRIGRQHPHRRVGARIGEAAQRLFALGEASAATADAFGAFYSDTDEKRYSIDYHFNIRYPSTETIRSTLQPDVDCTIEELEATLTLIQRLDPTGVAARSVSECVLLQLAQLSPDTPGLELAQRVAEDCLELVAENQLSALRRRRRPPPIWCAIP